MKRNFVAAGMVAVAMLLASGSTAQAGLTFTDPIDLNFSVFGGAFADTAGVEEIGFDGIAFSNHVDPGLDGPTDGDVVRSIAGLVATSLSDSLMLLPDPFGASMEMTATFDGTGVMQKVGLNGPGSFEVALSSGIMKWYIDTTPDYIKDDADTWTDTGATAELVATFSISGGLISFLSSGLAGSTEFVASLTSLDKAGFITDPGGVDPLTGLLKTLITTDDQPPGPLAPGVLPASVDSVFAGFSTGFGGATEADIGADLDGSANFEIVPEPSSFVLLALGGIAMCGAAVRRRRNAKKAA